MSLCLLPALAAMTGCGVDGVTTATSGTLALHGIVHGGQQPVTGSQIRLYSAGKTGNGSTPRDMLSVTASGGPAVDYVLTDGNGNFSITSDYSCTASTDQVYIVASGGYPGPSANPALVMTAVLGPCGTLLNSGANTSVFIDEVTTAAAAWALAPFTSATGQVGGSATNTTGIANAFLDAQLLANSSTGQPAALLSTQTIKTDKLYELANILAGCVNSDGTAACGPLFSAATTPSGSMPTNTWVAALNIVKNPGYHVGPVFMALPPQPPYPSQLTQAPNDWTMTMTVSGGGIFSPTALGVDPSGEVWVADYYGGVTGYSPQGAPLPGTPYGVGTPQAGDYAPDGEGHGVLSEVYGLAVDTGGNVWATVEESPYHSGTYGSVVTFAGASSGYALGTNLGQCYEPSLDYPESLAPDNLGNIYIGNYASGSVSVYNYTATNNPVCQRVRFGIGDYTNSSGNSVSDAAFPVSIAADGLGGTWIGNNDYTITHVDAYGNLYRPTCCDDVDGMAADAQGNGWAANYYSSSVSKVSPGSVSNGVYTPGTVLVNQVTGGGITYPAGLAIDSGQSVWVANYRGQSISELNASGTPVSPSTGFGLDAAISLPFSISPDASGNLWVTNFGNSTVTMFFGLATPTSTPVTAPQTAP